MTYPLPGTISYPPPPGWTPPQPPPPPGPTVYSDEQIAAMTPARVVELLEAGHLDATLGRTSAAVPASGQLGDEHLAHMTAAQIADAHEAGRLDGLLGRWTPEQG